MMNFPDFHLKFHDRKGNLSINVLVVVDFNLVFTKVIPKYAESSADSQILLEIKLDSELSEGGLYYGDLGLPNNEIIMTMFDTFELS